MPFSLQDLILGSGHKRTYTPEEQAVYSQRFPSLVWKDGVPYTPAPEPSFDPNDPYAYQSGVDSGQLVAATQNQPGGLVEADLNDPNILEQLARFAAVTSAMEYGAGKLPGGGPFGQSGFSGAGSGAVGGYSSATAAPALTAPNVGAALPGLQVGATLSGPSAGAAGAAGASGAMPVFRTVTDAAMPVDAAMGGAPALGAPNVGAALPGIELGAKLGTPPADKSGGWGDWEKRIKQLLPLGADIFRGINAKSALKDAQKTEQAATQQALKSQQAALQTAGDVYKQQRADTQNLAGQSFQTLGGLMGMNIAPIGAPTGAVPSTASPTGMPTGLVPASQTRPLQVNDPWVGGTPSDLVPYRGAPTLQQIAALGRKQQSASSYGKARA